MFIGALAAAAVLGGALWLHGYEATATTTFASSYRYEPSSKLCVVKAPQRLPGGGVEVVPPGIEPPACGDYTETRKWHPSWADPLALALAVAGVGVGASIILPRHRGSS